jgi:hypothetical protein
MSLRVRRESTARFLEEAAGGILGYAFGGVGKKCDHRLAAALKLLRSTTLAREIRWGHH